MPLARQRSGGRWRRPTAARAALRQPFVGPHLATDGGGRARAALTTPDRSSVSAHWHESPDGERPVASLVDSPNARDDGARAPTHPRCAAATGAAAVDDDRRAAALPAASLAAPSILPWGSRLGGWPLPAFEGCQPLFEGCRLL